MKRFDKIIRESMMLTQSDMKEMYLDKIKAGTRYKKFSTVFAKVAKGGEKIDTITKDGLETTNTAKEGDFIVQNNTQAKEQYILSKEKMKDRYSETDKLVDGMTVYKANGEVMGIVYKGDDIKFMADWNEEMQLKKDDMLVSPLPKLNEVYRIAIKEFNETYEKS